ncbi:erythromycin esterase family protein [Nocardia crassostreae]|uniref:erythromycin esterase family protein n=1 Tax=Nocardia crassostreae TaxID=53428 RepID=UPI00082DA445|nr:erythromycin esterase family protein [Nocardia crassostreae]
MSQDIRDFVPASCELLGLGEPMHREPAFALLRNELFAQLAVRGFRSIALESDRVAALTVNDFVREGIGTLDSVLATGFSHGFGEFEANRRLVAWMREYNENRPAAEQLAFHGFDGSMETMNVPSPRRYLEFARDYLKLDVDLASLAGADEQWDRSEAVLDADLSPGATAAAQRLPVIADDMLVELYARAPELIAAGSRDELLRAETYLTAGLGLLRYHGQAARHGFDDDTRWSRLSGTRDALMARNLFDIRGIEARRGPTLVCAHNLHLQKHLSSMAMGPMQLGWQSAGAIVGSLLGERYAFIAGSLGRSATIELGEPEPGTYEGLLQSRFSTWGLLPRNAVPAGRTRTDTTPRQGYFPPDTANLEGTAAILHIPG